MAADVPRGEYAAAKAEEEEDDDDDDDVAPNAEDEDELEVDCCNGDSLTGRERAVDVNATASSANDGALMRRCGREADPRCDSDRASEAAPAAGGAAPAPDVAGLRPKLPERLPAPKLPPALTADNANASDLRAETRVESSATPGLDNEGEENNCAELDDDDDDKAER